MYVIVMYNNLYSYICITHECTYIEIIITNGPNDTTVCINNTAEINCGFTGGDPETVFPDWKITRSDNGSNTTHCHDRLDVVNGNINGLQWVPDQDSGNNSSPNSKLLVGPVNKTLNQSSYQCIFGTVSGNTTSEVGIITVVGKIYSNHYKFIYIP